MYFYGKKSHRSYELTMSKLFKSCQSLPPLKSPKHSEAQNEYKIVVVKILFYEKIFCLLLPSYVFITHNLINQS